MQPSHIRPASRILEAGILEAGILQVGVAAAASASRKLGRLSQPHLFLLLGAVLLSTGCGRAHFKVLHKAPNLDRIQKIRVAKVKVTSQEQSERIEVLNHKWAHLSHEALEDGLKDLQRHTSSRRAAVIDTTISITYGNRALRYSVGFGAGKGYCTTNIKLRDRKGRIKFEVESRSSLSAGAFGGSMDKVIRKNVLTTVRGFLKRLPRRRQRRRAK